MISLPDGAYKIIAYLSLLGLGFFFMKIEKETSDYEQALRKFKEVIHNQKMELMDLEEYKREMLSDASFLSKKYKVSNPFTEKDSFIYFNRIINSSDASAVIVNDSLIRLFNEYKKQNFKTSKMIKELEYQQQIFDNVESNYDDMMNVYFIGLTISAIISLEFILRIMKEEKLKGKITKQELMAKRLPELNCHSCLNLFSTAIARGTNKDGTDSTHYCAKCFSKGEFTEPTMTLDKMASLICRKHKLKVIKFYIKYKLRQQDRWSTQIY